MMDKVMIDTEFDNLWVDIRDSLCYDINGDLIVTDYKGLYLDFET